jgi:hypothetical protein
MDGDWERRLREACGRVAEVADVDVIVDVVVVVP